PNDGTGAHRTRPLARARGGSHLAGAGSHGSPDIAGGASPRRHMMGFPQQRPRRTRQSDVWRKMVRETRLTPDAFIYPLFVVPGRGVRHAVESMPGISQVSVDEVVKDAKAVAAAGVPAVLVFAAPSMKDARASAALDPQGLAAQAISAIKES